MNGSGSIELEAQAHAGLRHRGMSEWRVPALGLLFIAVFGVWPIVGQTPDSVGEKLEAVWQEGRTLTNSGKVEEGLAKWQEGLRAAQEAKRDDYVGQMHVGIAVYYLNTKKDFGKAEEEALLALKLNPKLVQAHAILGLVYYALERWDEAERELKAGLDFKLWNGTALNQLVAIYKRTGRLDEAAAALQRLKDLVAEAPKETQPLARLVLALKEIGTPEEVVEASRRLVELNPTFSNYYSFAEWHQERGDWKEAEALYKEALEKNPKPAERVRACYNLAKSCIDRDAPDEALAILREVEKRSPEDPLIFAGLGAALWKKGELEQAEAAFKKSLALKPTLEAYHNYGAFCLEQLRDGEALVLAHKLVELEPRQVEARLSLINVLLRQKKPAEAVTQLREALKIDPGNADLHWRLGILLDDLGNAGEAEAAFKRSLSIHPSRFAYAGYTGFLVKHERFSEAEPLARKAVEMQPASPEGWMLLVAVLQKADKSAEALDALARAEKITPKNEEIYWRRAEILDGLGKTQEAEAAFQRSFALKRSVQAMAVYASFLQKHDQLVAAEKVLREATQMQPDNPSVLYGLGVVLQHQERWEESIEVLRKAVLLREKSGEKFVEALMGLALSYTVVGRQVEALELSQQMTSAFRASGNRVGEMGCLGITAELYAKQSEFSRAMAAYQETREFILRRFTPEERAGFPPAMKMMPTMAHEEIGKMLRQLGRQDEAIKRYEEAIDEARAVPEGAKLLPQLFSGLGQTFDEKNDYLAAIGYHLKALEAATKQNMTASRMSIHIDLLADFRATAQFDKVAATEADYRNLMAEPTKNEEQRASDAARLEEFLGNYDKVIGFCEKRLAAARKKGLRSPVAETLRALAHASGHLGKYKEAFDRYEEALVIERALPHPAGIAQCQRGMASALIGQSNYAEARKLLLEALTIVQSIGKVDDITSCLVSLGYLEANLGDYDAAIAYFDQAQEVHKRIGDTLGEARQLQNKAELWEERKDYGKALELSQKALALKRAVGNVLGTFRTLTQIGRQYMFLDRLPEAERYLQGALDLVSKARLAIGVELVQASLAELRVKQGRVKEAEKLLLPITASDAKTGYPLDWNAWYLLGLAQKENGNAGDAITSLVQSVEIVERLREATRGSASDRLFLAKYRKVYQEIIQLLLEQNQLEEAYRYIEKQKIAEIQENDPHQGFDDPAKAAAYRTARGLKFKEIELQKQIAAELGKPESQRDEEFIANLQSLLGQIEKQFNLYVENLPREMRMEFVVNPLQLSVMRKSIPAGVLVVQLQVTPQGDEIGILIHSQGTSVARTRKVEGANVNSEVMRYRNLLMDEHADEAEIHQLGARLYDWLLRPLEAELADAKLLVVSASGALRRIPFAALYDGETKQFLVEKPLPVVNLGLLKNLEAAAPQRALKIFAIANPDSSDPQLALPKTEEQVAELKRLFPNTRIVARDEATLESLSWKPGANDFNVLLFATHAALDDAQPRKSYIRLARQQKLTHENIPLYTARWPQVRLAVLSACETAARATGATDNFALGSLAEKFDSQGIPSVLGSLWPVADFSTAELMTGFFQGVQAKMTLAEALRQAQVAVLRSEKCRHPYYWAPFILIGEWR